MRSLGRPVLGRGKETVSERINLNNCKRIDSGGPWVIKTRHKTQNYFNTREQLKKPPRTWTDIYVILVWAEGSNMQMVNSSGCNHLKGWSAGWEETTTAGAASQQFVGSAWYFTQPCCALHHGMCAPFHRMPAQQWDDIGTQVMPSSHSTQREGLEAGGTTCRAAPTLFPPEVVGAYQKKAAAVEDTWMKKNRICILTLGAAWLNSVKNLVYNPYKTSHILG